MVELPILIFGLGAEHSLRSKIAGWILADCLHVSRRGISIASVALEPLLGIAVALPGSCRAICSPRRMWSVSSRV